MVQLTRRKSAFNHRADGSRKRTRRKPTPTQRNNLSIYFPGENFDDEKEKIEGKDAVMSYYALN